MLLEAREVTVRYGGLTAVDGVSLELDAGQVVGLIGPNGAGKTTLLSAIGGQLVPDAGSVVVDGVEVTEWAPERRALVGMSRTFQRLELFRKMTAFDNLLVAAEARFGEADFVADVLGRRRRGRGAEVAGEVLGRLGLSEVAARWADELPLGVGRLVELGRALCADPRMLLLDEPSGGLDERETDRLAEVLRGLTDGGPAMLLVEHDVRLVMALCERIAVMEFGRLIAEGTPAEIRRSQTVRQAYLGGPGG